MLNEYARQAQSIVRVVVVRMLMKIIVNGKNMQIKKDMTKHMNCILESAIAILKTTFIKKIAIYLFISQIF